MTTTTEAAWQVHLETLPTFEFEAGQRTDLEPPHNPDAEPDPLALRDVRPEHVETHRLLALVLAKLDAIEQRLDAREGPADAPLSRVDRHLHAAIAPEVSAAVGDSVWTVRELFDHAGQRDPDLRGALDAAIGLDDGAGRRLGRFLARVAGFAIEGFTVARIAETRDGATWRITRVSLPQSRERA